MMESQLRSQDEMASGTLMGLPELEAELDFGAYSTSVMSTPFVGSMTLESPIIFQSEFDSQSNSINMNSGFSNVPKVEQNQNASKSNLHLRPESARDSITSSMADMDDASSILSSAISSKATSPTGFDGSSRENTKAASQIGRKRIKYDIRPKVSIPADLPPSEYARQCIAAAESSRLNPYSLHPEEHSMLRNHITHPQVTTYLNIRNGILRLWVRNPMIGVIRDEAIGCAKDTRWFDVARISYEWLVRRGYINYGCVEHLDSSKENPKRRPGRPKRQTVAVIGAGMAGLGCARQLEGLFAQFQDRFCELGEDPPRVVVLEGRDRIGGRVYSRALKSKPNHPTLSTGSRHTAEMGGMIITGFDRGNPLNIIVRGQLALPYHALKPDTTIYDATGRPVDTNRDLFAEKLFNYILDRVSEYKYKLPIPPTAEGDKEHLDSGRDINNEGLKTICEVEDTPAITSQPGSKSNTPATPDLQLIPVSSDRLTGRAHFEPGIPGVHTAAYEAKEIGWQLRPNVGIEYDLDLETAVGWKYSTLGSVFDEAIRQYNRILDFTPLDLRLINWHVANLEYSNATYSSQLSLGGWDLDAGNEWEGKHTMVTGGYQQVPRGLLNCPKALEVRRKNNVKKIKYSTDQSKLSEIECENGDVISADYIVSSIPLGVLKTEDVQFEPELPDWKTGAIQRIGFGVLNKVVLVYKEPFWDQGRDIFGLLRNPPNRFSLDQKDYFEHRGRFFQWFNVSKTSGLPTLLALMAGKAGYETEKLTNEDLVVEATGVLRTIFGAPVPEPIEAVVTRWKSDKFAYGSYSYTGPMFQPDDYDMMAKPVGNLFFAGEHTCGTHPATVHGAYISGLRAASEVLESMIGPIDIPEPLILPKDSATKRKSEAVQGAKDPKQARLEAYEIQVWNAIYTSLGDRPWRPTNTYANPYRMYTKEKWEEAKRKCEEGRRPGKGKPIPNEVKKMVTKMWKEAREVEKKPFNDIADAQKKSYAVALKGYNEKSAEWDKAALAFRAEYEKSNPSAPGPDEGGDSPSRRARRVKRVDGYAEDSGSELDL